MENFKHKFLRTIWSTNYNTAWIQPLMSVRHSCFNHSVYSIRPQRHDK